MSLIREVFSGYVARIRLENSLQLQAAQLVRPMEVKVKTATTIVAINEQLKDAPLKKVYDAIVFKLPE